MKNIYRRTGLPACPGIYSITHIATDRRYIGSARDIRRRAYTHRSQLRHGRHTSRRLQNAWTKYGEDAFAFEVLETCLDEPTILVAREQYWIDRYRGSLLNTRKIAEQFSGEWYRTPDGEKYRERRAELASEMWRERQPTRRACEYCGREFFTKVTDAVPARWCSRRCAYHGQSVKKACVRCGQAFSCHQSKPREHCSRHCWALANHATRLPDDKVAEIKRRLATGEVQRRIAEDMGVSFAAVCRINRGTRYID